MNDQQTHLYQNRPYQTFLAFIEFKKYQKEMSMYIKPTSNTSKVDLMINNGVHSEEFERMKDLPLKQI